MEMTSHRGKIKLGGTFQMLVWKSKKGQYLKVSATEPSFSGAYQAEKATIAGIWSKQTCRAYAEPISILRVSRSVISGMV